MIKQIIKNKEIVADSWQQLSDDDALPDSGKIIINYQRWLQLSENLRAFNGQLGICISADIAIDAIKDELDQFQLIAIRFPEFKDGRGYTHARILRERYNFQGELRATGNILRDQIFYLHRCGFDAFELENGRDIKDALNAFTDFGANYQPAAI